MTAVARHTVNMDRSFRLGPRKLIPWIVLITLDLLCDVSDGASQAEINKHLEIGRKFLSSGQYQDALTHYHAAIEGDNSNAVSYFSRGTVYLALGKANLALADFDKVLELKPDFAAARVQRSHILVKQARLDEAAEELDRVFAWEPHNPDAAHFRSLIDPARHDIALAEAFMRGRDYPAAVELITKILEICPWSSMLRELRAEAHTALGDSMAAISDIRSTTRLLSDNTAGFFKLSLLYYKLGQAPESLKEIRECLKLDPEHKDCFPHYKKVKKVEKQLNDAQEALQANDYKRCIDMSKKVLVSEPNVANIRFQAHDKLCQCYHKDDQITESLQSCQDALDIHMDARILCDRAEVYIASSMFDDAVRDYHKALDIEEDYQRAKEGIQRAQKLQKQAERRDYYKILGVSRNAGKQEIIKAYRKAAQKWHPDNFQQNESEKKIAEKKFIDIAAAKEVLTDPEKRQKYDNGEDPLDPESGQHNGFNPFQQFHQFHHGSPFQFKFHFN
ncbi:dnaJ homolog subfamily C member 3 [Thrips palmi]|uniref:DnaJ homolog subfamily C member 3 n=1 Tax=Thrips palmi TaxID=161013 RepID=A0A6P8Y7Q7_THRPL|nr:dnaJ homolog subfamily C member 3 [Thrips palmi]XP_034232662.1 dnaJ homolog subfamily C member 3 [Thrips palmi]